ncbi:HAMP domain-containing sensor histidine kinase [Blautia sp. JLR.GB0024]|uniref:sensor histidine kinase n=1 Tax=Blautia sp. JLR.GB0024 TaxID=3123295 RepID=UPI003007BF4D
MSVVVIAVGIWNIRKYGKLKFDEKKGELGLQKKIRDAHTTVPIFVHSIKNQILAERVIQKRLDTELQKDVPDKESLKNMLGQLHTMNQNMLERMEELYRSVKTGYIHLVPVSPEEILKTADSRFHQKYPEGMVKYQCEKGYLVLADKKYLGEAVSNLLTNAYEAGIPGQAVSVWCTVKAEKLYLLIHIKDNGRGMDKEECKKIFEPFYTSKNTNYNWGMGLAYVMQTVKEHLGMIRVESMPGKGTDFYIYIPIYKGHKAKESG